MGNHPEGTDELKPSEVKKHLLEVARQTFDKLGFHTNAKGNFEKETSEGFYLKVLVMVSASMSECDFYLLAGIRSKKVQKLLTPILSEAVGHPPNKSILICNVGYLHSDLEERHAKHWYPHTRSEAERDLQEATELFVTHAQPYLQSLATFAALTDLIENGGVAQWCVDPLSIPAILILSGHTDSAKTFIETNLFSKYPEYAKVLLDSLPRLSKIT